MIYTSGFDIDNDIAILSSYGHDPDYLRVFLLSTFFQYNDTLVSYDHYPYNLQSVNTNIYRPWNDIYQLNDIYEPNDTKYILAMDNIVDWCNKILSHKCREGYHYAFNYYKQSHDIIPDILNIVRQYIPTPIYYHIDIHSEYNRFRRIPHNHKSFIMNVASVLYQDSVDHVSHVHESAWLNGLYQHIVSENGVLQARIYNYNYLTSYIIMIYIYHLLYLHLILATKNQDILNECYVQTDIV